MYCISSLKSLSHLTFLTFINQLVLGLLREILTRETPLVIRLNKIILDLIYFFEGRQNGILEIEHQIEHWLSKQTSHHFFFFEQASLSRISTRYIY